MSYGDYRKCYYCKEPFENVSYQNIITVPTIANYNPTMVIHETLYICKKCGSKLIGIISNETFLEDHVSIKEFHGQLTEIVQLLKQKNDQIKVLIQLGENT